jgi:ABC-type branched-subunit amino acid transport system ATPase component
MSLLRIDQLRAGYGPVNVLDGIQLHVDQGEFVVMLGANGAGKTTTMRAISGLIPRHGVVEFEGHDIHKASADSIVRAGVAQVPQGRGTFPELSVEDNMLGPAPTCATVPMACTTTCTSGSRSSLASPSVGISAPAASAVANSRCSPSPVR